MNLGLDLRDGWKTSYALKRVAAANLRFVERRNGEPRAGEILLAQVEKIGKNTGLELADGRRSTLHLGDRIAVVLGNRYATGQFEGYAETNGDRCDLLSMGGLCGLVRSKHVGVGEPTKLRLLGGFVDPAGQSLRLSDFALPRTVASSERPRVLVVCGTSMDAGKTHTVMSLIKGLRKEVDRVAGIKLTGTATGRDTWSMHDAGACAALDFVDGGMASTYLTSTEELLDLYDRLIGHARQRAAEWVVVEIADGLLQRETAALLQSPRFTEGVDRWVFAAGDPLAACAGHALLRSWGIEPVAISGLMTMSPLAVKEARLAVDTPCFTADELQGGLLNDRLFESPVGTTSVPTNGLVLTEVAQVA